MADYLLDTNVLLRLADSKADEHRTALHALDRLLANGDLCFITAQIVIEFWAVATRQREANGLGWGVPETRSRVARLLEQFRFLEETPSVFAR